jgi:multiple sugar transport system ATP-binding protein
MRPEDFEDASLVNDQSRGLKFNARIDVLESMGSEFYAYFVVESERVASRELEELADDAGGADLPQQDGSQIVARLDAASTVRQGQDTELWFNAEHLQLFDPESGKTLLGGTGSSPSSPPQTASQPAPGEQAT